MAFGSRPFRRGHPPDGRAAARGPWAGRSGRVVVVLALAVGPVSGCGTDPGPVCGAVVDSTGYADPVTARNDVDSELPGFAKGCDWIGFAAVTGSSESSACREDPVPIAATRTENPGDDPAVEDRVRARRIQQVLPRAVGLFDCPKEGRGSDVLGALRYAVKQLSALRQPDREHRLIVFSDLLNDRGDLDVGKLDLGEAARGRKIGELRAARLLPDLSGYAVVVHGFLRAKKSAPGRFPLLESFWREAFEAAGASSVDLL
ncbi:hypothetical protein [Nonomuraea sp. NPDC049684]|uniref:hypothetical protein n=1 Tax=Nonomuraea sp. NPDC049684 TaxID=3364356 RepID=UPI0037B02213